MIDGDAAALVPECMIDLLSQRLAEAGCIPNIPFLGAESDPTQLLHTEMRCPKCK